MAVIEEARRFARYLLGKRSEIEDLDLKDVVLAKAILDIHRKRTHKTVERIPLESLKQIHRLDRPNAIEATRRRVEALERHKTELLETGTLTCETLARVLPSVSWIKTVQRGPDEYLAFEGNGRIAVMRSVFEPEDGICVEVEQYHFRNPAKIIRRLDRVRRMNGLPGGGGE